MGQRWVVKRRVWRCRQRPHHAVLHCWPLKKSWECSLSKKSNHWSASSLEVVWPLLYLEKVTLATWCKELTHWKRFWCWERLKAEGEGVDRGWDGWMASLIQWTWVWASSGNWWWTGKPGVLQSMGSQSQTWLSHWTEPWLSSTVHIR